MVVSLLLVLNFSIGVSASNNYDRQEADAYITISERLSVKTSYGKSSGNTKVNYKTGQIYDSISKKWVNPENVELGRVANREFWYLRDMAESQGMTQAQFNDFMNNPEFYAWQDIYSNRSHKYENPH